MHSNFLSVAIYDEYIRAAPDAQLSSPQTLLLTTLLSEEDQHDYNQLTETSLPHDILHILYQLASLLDLSSSTIWTSIVLLKKLILQQHSIDLLTIVASLTLSFKYQESSPHHIDYDRIVHYCQLDNIQSIHDAETMLLDCLSYDISVTTPDHFFSYLSNLYHHDHTIKHVIQQATSLLSPQLLQLVHNYSSSIVALSLIYITTSNTFIIEQIKSFLRHKKDSTHYFTELLHCTAQLQSATAQS